MERLKEQLIVRTTGESTVEITRREVDPWQTHLDRAIERARNILALRPLKIEAPKPWPLRWASAIPEELGGELLQRTDCYGQAQQWRQNRWEDRQMRWIDPWYSAPGGAYQACGLWKDTEEDRPELSHVGVRSLSLYGVVFACMYAFESGPSYRHSVLYLEPNEMLVDFKETTEFADSVYSFAARLHKERELPLRLSLGIQNALGAKVHREGKGCGPAFPDREFRSDMTIKAKELFETSDAPGHLYDNLTHGFGFGNSGSFLV